MNRYKKDNNLRRIMKKRTIFTSKPEDLCLKKKQLPFFDVLAFHNFFEQTNQSVFPGRRDTCDRGDVHKY